MQVIKRRSIQKETKLKPQKDPTKSYYLTKVKAGEKLIITGEAELNVKEINRFNEIEILFIHDKSIKVKKDHTKKPKKEV